MNPRLRWVRWRPGAPPRPHIDDAWPWTGVDQHRHRGGGGETL